MTNARLVIADLHGLAGSMDGLRALVDELAGASREEAGCLSFRVLDGEDVADLVVLSTWRDEPAMIAHFNTPHYQRYRRTVGPLLARPSDVVVFHVSETVHALDPNPPDPDRFD
jgi:quinol monooxygenase YgiN